MLLATHEPATTEVETTSASAETSVIAGWISSLSAVLRTIGELIVTAAQFAINTVGVLMSTIAGGVAALGLRVIRAGSGLSFREGDVQLASGGADKTKSIYDLKQGQTLPLILGQNKQVDLVYENTSTTGNTVEWDFQEVYVNPETGKIEAVAPRVALEPVQLSPAGQSDSIKLRTLNLPSGNERGSMFQVHVTPTFGPATIWFFGPELRPQGAPPPAPKVEVSW